MKITYNILPCILAFTIFAVAQTPSEPPPPKGVAIEAEDFKPVGEGWKVIKNGEGNYMVDIVGFNHISGERVLSAPSKAKDAKAVATVQIPEDGDYRVWSRYETPTGTEERFRVEIRQEGKLAGSAVMGEKDAPKYWYSGRSASRDGFEPVGQYDASWGSEGLAEQGFDVKGLKAGPAEITLVAVDQPELAANRNVDLLFLTRDLKDGWRTRFPTNPVYPILDAAMECFPPRYYLRLTSPQAMNAAVTYSLNRVPWGRTEATVPLEANKPSAWIPLRNQDVSHFNTVVISGSQPGLDIKVELAGSATGTPLLRALDWKDPANNVLHIGLPPYPGKYKGEQIITAEEQYKDIVEFLKPGASKVGREPTVPLAWSGQLPVWEKGREADAGAEVYHDVGMRVFGGYMQPPTLPDEPLQVARERFAKWGLTPGRTIALGQYRWMPTTENIAATKKAAEDAKVLPLLQRFDYGDEIGFAEWLALFMPDQFKKVDNDAGRKLADEWTKNNTAEWKKSFPVWQMGIYNKVEFDTLAFDAKTAETNAQWYVESVNYYQEMRLGEALQSHFADWQKQHRGKVNFQVPNSSAKTSETNAMLFVDSTQFYEDSSIAKVAEMAKDIPKALGTEVLYGANVACHPFYYPEIPKYIKWFRRGAANFGRHSEYFWEVGQPGPLVNGYIADHFRSGMRDNPKALFLQYTMPHSPGNSDQSFRRSAFTHLAHGARGLDYFGIGVNYTFSENHIDFRDKGRYAAIRDINRSMALIEDILPESHVEPSQVAMIMSDSTERWDLAGIASDKTVLNVFGPDYKKTRLCYHTDRLGIYYTLVHGSRPPDMLIEEDVIAGKLKDYKVAYWVGDCADPKMIKPLEEWVKAGGHLVATAGALRCNAYKQPVPEGLALLGLKSGKLDEKQTFFRMQIEMPRMTPLDTIGNMPVFSVVDHVEAGPDANIIFKFKSGGPAVVERTLGKGKITFIAALPGVTYLWSAHQPAQPPPRGVWSHAPWTNFNADAGALILAPAKAVTSQVEAEGGLIDARLLKSPKGYAVPLANYSVDTQKPVTLTIRGVKGIKKITSASQGELKMEKAPDDAVKVTYSTGFGDILRVDAP